MKNAQQLLTEIEAYEKVLLNENKKFFCETKTAKANKLSVSIKPAK